MNALVWLEHDHGQVRPSSLSALQAARHMVDALGGTVRGLLIGSGLSQTAEHARTFAPVWTADDASLVVPVADQWAELLARVVRQQHVDLLVAAANTSSKDIVARAGGLLGGAMASDVVAHHVRESELHFVRPMYAGAILATVRLLATPRIVTVRSSAYPRAEPSGQHEIHPVELPWHELPRQIEVLGCSERSSERPDVTEARIVVSGGRAIQNSDDFERLVGGLADALEGATGSSRALVDAGITPNSLQVGQTGKVIAPDLYVAIGISGAVQHLAGMKNSKTIIAINHDRDAPIFEVADFGWIADAYQAVPELVRQLTHSK